MSRGGSRPGIRHQITHDRYLAAELENAPSSSVAVTKHQGLECFKKLSHLQERCIPLAPCSSFLRSPRTALLALINRSQRGSVSRKQHTPGVYPMFVSQVGPRAVTRLVTRDRSDMPPQVGQSDPSSRAGKRGRAVTLVEGNVGVCVEAASSLVPFERRSCDIAIQVSCAPVTYSARLANYRVLID